MKNLSAVNTRETAKNKFQHFYRRICSIGPRAAINAVNHRNKNHRINICDSGRNVTTFTQSDKNPSLSWKAKHYWRGPLPISVFTLRKTVGRFNLNFKTVLKRK